MIFRKILFFLIPTLQSFLAVAFVVFGILDNNGCSAFVDHATPYVGIILFWSYLPSVITTYFSGRKLQIEKRNKIFVITFLTLVALPWILSCFIFLLMATWQGD